MNPIEELEYWKEEYPELTEEEIVEILEMFSEPEP